MPDRQQEKGTLGPGGNSPLDMEETSFSGQQRQQEAAAAAPQRERPPSDGSVVSANQAAEERLLLDSVAPSPNLTLPLADQPRGRGPSRVSRVQSAIRRHLSSTSSSEPSARGRASSSSTSGAGSTSDPFASRPTSSSGGSLSSPAFEQPSIVISDPMRRPRRLPPATGPSAVGQLSAADVDIIVEEEAVNLDEDDVDIGADGGRDYSPYSATTTTAATALPPISNYQRSNAKEFSVGDSANKKKGKRKLFGGITKMTRALVSSARSVPASEGSSAHVNTPSFTDLFEGERDEAFLREVASVQQNEGVPHEQALQLCRVKRLIADKGSAESALFFLLDKSATGLEITEMVNLMFNLVTVDVSQTDDSGRTFLHVVAGGRLVETAEELIGQKVPTDKRDDSGRFAVEYALDNNNDKMAALLMSAMSKEEAQTLFFCSLDDGAVPKYNFHTVASNCDMVDTAQAIMDVMVEKLGNDQYRFHFSVLEADPSGRPPDHPDFTTKKGLIYSKIADCKKLRGHNLMRVLIHHKWAKYGETKAIKALLLYLVYVAFCSFAFIAAGKQRADSFRAASNGTAATHGDPSDYNNILDYSRGAIEGVLLILTAVGLTSEVIELKQIGAREYFTDVFNYYQLVTSFSFFILIPLRLYNSEIQWEFMAVLYLLVNLRILKSISILRITGIYLQILVKIMVRDMVRFFIIYLIFLLSFSGSMYLMLVGVDYVDSGGKTGTELDRTEEMSDYPHIVVTLLRIMVQNENVGTYFGTGYFWATILLRIVYLFMVLTVLLNILIAQLSDTYAEIKQDAQFNLERNWCDQLQELEKSFAWDKKAVKKVYESSTVITDPKKLLLSWDEPVDFEAKLRAEHQRRLMEQQLYKQEQLLFAIKAQLASVMSVAERSASTGHQISRDFPLANDKMEETILGMIDASRRQAVDETTSRLQQSQAELREQLRREIRDMVEESQAEIIERITERIPDNIAPPI